MYKTTQDKCKTSRDKPPDLMLDCAVTTMKQDQIYFLCPATGNRRNANSMSKTASLPQGVNNGARKLVHMYKECCAELGQLPRRPRDSWLQITPYPCPVILFVSIIDQRRRFEGSREAKPDLAGNALVVTGRIYVRAFQDYVAGRTSVEKIEGEGVRVHLLQI